MFERFTPPARQAVALALDQAGDAISTRELLYGLLLEGEGIAARVLRARGLAEPPAPVRRRGGGQLPFTHPAKLSLEAAVAEADALGHGAVGTEHLLLGVLGHAEEEARAVLPADPAALRDDVLRALGGA